jgi:hypothetical protein
MMPTRRSRPFTLLDALALVMATAVGLAVTRSLAIFEWASRLDQVTFSEGRTFRFLRLLDAYSPSDPGPPPGDQLRDLLVPADSVLAVPLPGGLDAGGVGAGAAPPASAETPVAAPAGNPGRFRVDGEFLRRGARVSSDPLPRERSPPPFRLAGLVGPHMVGVAEGSGSCRRHLVADPDAQWSLGGGSGMAGSARYAPRIVLDWPGSPAPALILAVAGHLDIGGCGSRLRRIGGRLIGAARQARDDVGTRNRRSRGERFQASGVEVYTMERDRPRWRVRLSTLMLLVIILALALTLVSERWKREHELRRLDAEQQRAVAQAQARRAVAAAHA